MEHISQRDIRTFHAVLAELDAGMRLDRFSQHVVQLLHRLVPYDIATYNEIDPVAGRITVVAAPVDSLPVDGEQRFMAHVGEHPILQYVRERSEAQALKLSDFVSQRQLHQLGLYREFYAPLAVEHQLVLTLPATPPLVIGIALNRGRGDFSERDRLLLNLLQPHLKRAHANALMRTSIGQTLQALERVLEAEGRGVVLLRKRGEQPLLSAQAARWLDAYWGRRSGRSSALPEAVIAWIRQQRASASDALSRDPRASLVVQRGDNRLHLQFLAGSDADDLDLVLLRETCVGQRAAPPAAPLTPREREVLQHLSQGNTDRQIAAALGISTRTVHKHVEHLLAKLRVGSRTAAAAWALRGGQPPE
jgi:DNA-binding CsgD family transcriptional regulator